MKDKYTRYGVITKKDDKFLIDYEWTVDIEKAFALWKEKHWKEDGTPINITFEVIRSLRSINQNNYYWGVIVKRVSEETLNDKDVVHNYFRGKFLQKRYTIKTKDGEKEKVTLRSTADLNTKEAEEYYEKCRIEAATEFGIDIPLPNEADWDKLEFIKGWEK